MSPSCSYSVIRVKYPPPPQDTPPQHSQTHFNALLRKLGPAMSSPRSQRSSLGTWKTIHTTRVKWLEPRVSKKRMSSNSGYSTS